MNERMRAEAPGNAPNTSEMLYPNAELALPDDEPAQPGSDPIPVKLSRFLLELYPLAMSSPIGEFEEPKVNPPGPDKPPTKLAVKLPDRKLVPKEDWSGFESVYGGTWTGQDTVKVQEDQDGITVYINKEPDVLTEFPKRNPKYNSGDAMSAIQKRYIASVYIYAIAMFFEMKDKPDNRDWAIPASLRAISKFLLDLAFTNRASDHLDDED